MRKNHSEYYDKFKDYLTDKAKECLDMMIKCDIDPDLALFMLEQKWPDTEIYTIPTDHTFRKVSIQGDFP